MAIKKFILPIVLSIVIALSGIILFGCGEKEEKEKSYDLYSSVMDTIKQDSSLFETKTANGLSTQFSIKDIGFKTSQNSGLEGYEYYVTVLGAGLEFIDDYYEKLNTTQGVVKNASLNNSVRAMKKGYENVKSEHDKLLSINNINDISYEIYNAHFYNYRISVTNFINKVYDCAFSLAKYNDRYLNMTKDVGKESMTKEQFDFYIDYEYLKIYEDFKVLLIDSGKGADLDTQLFAFDVYETFNKLATSEKTSDLIVPPKPEEKPDESGKDEGEVEAGKVADAAVKDEVLNNEDKDEEKPGESENEEPKPNPIVEKVKSLKTVFARFAENRKDVRQAMKKFSVYKFVEVYGEDIVAYKNDFEDAPAYYEKLKDYFTNDDSTLKLLFLKLENEVVAK